MFQASFSVILHSLMGGIVFAKLSKPKNRTETLIFSRSAVIARRDGTFSLMCRVGDMRRSHIIEACAKMYLVRERKTQEGEVIPFNTQELKLENQFIFMPVIIEHIIDDSSPLYELIKPLLNCDNVDNFVFKNDFEILVVLQGILESTGQTTQKKTSFLPSEILINHVFEPLLNTSESRWNKATIDFSKFDHTRKVQKTYELKKFNEIFDLEKLSKANISNEQHQQKMTPVKIIAKKFNETFKTNISSKSFTRIKNKNSIFYKSV